MDNSLHNKIQLTAIDSILFVSPSRKKFWMADILKTIEDKMTSASNDIGCIQVLEEGEKIQLRSFFHLNGSSGMLARMFEQGYVNDEFEAQTYLTKAGRKAKQLGGHAQYRKHQQDKKERAKQVELSSIRTNESVRATNRIQWVSILVTLVIIGLSCYFQWKTWDVADDALIFQKKQVKEERARQQLLQLELRDLKVKQAAMYKQIDSIQKRLDPKRDKKKDG